MKEFLFYKLLICYDDVRGFPDMTFTRQEG